ncbi:RES family NAD+ phosphorylase [Litchfieldella xinjiangensis]|uniref:RES family NAD+ phosphorylase n=1 Tax=Litchfieldella xinjiangensis TaxID=1166948 RepID=UPI0005BDB861|nr:RES family NAD+ phosphorylase [Halomonas xinjiangensis]
MTQGSLWRISQFQDLSGIGGTKVAGRWHNKGRPIVYLGDCPAICLLEILVHMEGAPDELPKAFTLLRLDLPMDALGSALTVELDANWRDDLNSTRRLGDDWLAAGESLLLRVPSSIVPHNMNYLFNPLYPDAGKAVLSSESFPADRRLYPQV